MYDYKAKLVRVIDGDSIVLDIDLGFEIELKNKHIRLIGINAPEVRTRDLEEKRLGFLAKDFVEDLFKQVEEGGGKIVLVSHNYDKFGRILGEILLTFQNATINLNEELLRTGHAVKY